MLRPDAFEIVALADGVHAVLRRDPPDDAANGNVVADAIRLIKVAPTFLTAAGPATTAAAPNLTPGKLRSA